jgi:predicted phosphodiesterase
VIRIGVMSDVHGNAFALDAALADMRKLGLDQLVCLGDAIQGGAQPAETAARLRELGCPVVMGNADAWLLDEAVESGTVSPAQREVRAWTLSRLRADDVAMIRAFRPTVEVPLGDGQKLLCFHGSPTSYDDILLPTTPGEEWQRLLGPCGPALMAGGHTHTQQLRHVGEGMFFNPGSIGLVYDVLAPQELVHNAAWAEYAVLTYDRGAVGLTFCRAPYDVEILIEIIRASGRPHTDPLIAGYRRAVRGS